MDFQQIFQEYYALFRGDSSIPAVTDPEWALGVYAGNAAIRRWYNVDAEKWDVLWTTAVAQGFSNTYSGTNTPTTTTYDCPSNMGEPGGFIQLTDPVSGTYIHISVVKLQDVQFQNQANPYAYFTGGPQQGYQMVLNFSGTSNNGWIIDFPMYALPTYFDASLNALGNVNEDGTTITEVPDSSFIVNFMLGKRLFETRNPFFQQANKDSETNLKGMQLKNGTGTPGNTWNINDNNKTGSFGPTNTPAITNSGIGF
jgi:hypothetical protein